VSALRHLAQEHGWRQMWLFGMSESEAMRTHMSRYPDCEHEHEWRDTGFANLDDCGICGTTRERPLDTVADRGDTSTHVEPLG